MKKKNSRNICWLMFRSCLLSQQRTRSVTVYQPVNHCCWETVILVTPLMMVKRWLNTGSDDSLFGVNKERRRRIRSKRAKFSITLKRSINSTTCACFWTVPLPPSQAFSQVLGAVAGSCAAGLNVLLQYVSHFLQAAGFQGNIAHVRTVFMFLSGWVFSINNWTPVRTVSTLPASALTWSCSQFSCRGDICHISGVPHDTQLIQ